ncbi:protein TAPT1 homolog isoform X2 [Lycorma delicatula]|uniref:protein TAPT1 homolog isoform X2 n=1 Tax=Lycorma delicatula TaxID=130591 RepID=UPI003F5157D6
MSQELTDTFEKKIKFRSISSTTDPGISAAFNNKVEELSQRPRSKSEQKYKKKDLHLATSDDDPSLWSFLGVELTRGYILEHEEEQYSARREKVYSFMKIPREVEKFMAYGFFQCADSFLFVYTFLPMRFLLALWNLITQPVKKCFGNLPPRHVPALRKHLNKIRRKSKIYLKPAEICDLLKASILIVTSGLMFYVDTSMVYHLIKSQSVIKLYIFYNMLEVGDRLFSAFGQDIIDALFWTATEPRDRKREHLGVIPHHLFAIVYVFLHGILVLCQATTLNVAINSNNKALLTIMMSNNFVELKGSVFKKFDKNNLFQVACSDCRERFHLFFLLFIVVLQTMKEYAWSEETFWVLLPDCLMVLLAEILVDWIKHAFITRFNELPVDVYRDYTLSLAYDLAQTRQKNAFSDHSDLVARRMGFIPLPLGVVAIRVLGTAVKIQGPAACCLALLGYLCIASFRVLNNIIILGRACDMINRHQQENMPVENSPVRIIKDSATSPTRPVGPLRRSATVEVTISTPTAPPTTPADSDPRSTLGPGAIFSNSAVSITDVCLNEEMLRVGVAKLESIGEAEPECLTRSVPNIQQIQQVNSTSPIQLSAPPSPELSKKRAESEPNIPSIVDNEESSSNVVL